MKTSRHRFLDQTLTPAGRGTNAIANSSSKNTRSNSPAGIFAQPTGVRTVLKRIAIIFATIVRETEANSRKLPNATSFAEELEVTPKTIYRDIDFLRDQMGMPIEFDGSRCGYRFNAPVALPWWLKPFVRTRSETSVQIIKGK